MLPQHGETAYPPNPIPQNHLELNPYDCPISNPTAFGGTRPLGANTPLFCDCFRGPDDPDSTAASQPIESIYLCVNCGRFRFPAYSGQNSMVMQPALPSYICRKCKEPSDSNESSDPGVRRRSHRRRCKDVDKRGENGCLSSRQDVMPNCAKGLQSRRSYCTCHSCTDPDNIGCYDNQCTHHLPGSGQSSTKGHRRRLIRANRSSSGYSDDIEERYKHDRTPLNHTGPAVYQGQRQNGSKWLRRLGL